MIRLSKSGIEYLDYAWNFYSGCTHWKKGVCPVEKCWAKSITERFKSNYPKGFEPTFYPEALLSPLRLKKPSIIGCAFMGDLFLDEIDSKRIVMIPFKTYSPRFGSMLLHGQLRPVLFGILRACPQHTFLFLTKNPEKLVEWSPFPDNCWVGVTITNPDMAVTAANYLNGVEAPIVYLSIEPFLEHIPARLLDNFTKLNQIIIGAQTKPYKPPKIEWVQEIVEACDKAGVAVFLKDNLEKLFGDLPYSELEKLEVWNRIDHADELVVGVELRQEMPNG